MDSEFKQQQYQHHFQGLQRQFHHQKPQTNSLTRFRSAPSSYFASFLDAVDNTVGNTINFGGSANSITGSGSGERGDFANARPLSPETENIFANFMSSMGGEKNTTSSQKLCDIPENSPVQQPSQFMVGVKQESETFAPQQQQQQQQQQRSIYSGSSQQMVYHNQSKPSLANQNNSVSSSFGAAQNSMGMDSLSSQMKIRRNNNSSGLTRHSSSPAGFFADILNLDNGFGIMKGMENYGGGGGSGGGGVNSRINFSSDQATPASGLMRQNSDVEAKAFNNSGNNNDESNYISTGFNNMNSWDDSILSDKYSSLDRGAGDDDRKIFSELNASENQSGDGRNRPPPLAHHLSLPNTSAELSALEKLLQFQDTVPCRIRAKRGCATHPRSIAERVRRTRISERMRKLQDLVPNMDKQTNTADMLDLAVEYIKDLQSQVKNLNDNRAKCTCS